MSSMVANDALVLSKNDECVRMLLKMGDNYPEPEQIQLSEQVIKINSKQKEQKRVLLVTDKALYNLIPNSYKQCKRRIPIEKIASITISTASQQFAIHIPDEYDYLFKSTERARIVSSLKAGLKKKGFNLKTFITSDDNMQTSNLLQRKKINIGKSALSLKNVFGRKKQKIISHQNSIHQQKSKSFGVGGINVSKLHNHSSEQKELSLSPTIEEEETDKLAETWSPNPLTLQSASTQESVELEEQSQVNQIIFDQNNMEAKEQQPTVKKKKPSIVIEASYSEDAMQQYFAEYGTMPESVQTMDAEHPELFNQYTIDRVQTYFTQHGTMPSQEYLM